MAEAGEGAAPGPGVRVVGIEQTPIEVEQNRSEAPHLPSAGSEDPATTILDLRGTAIAKKSRGVREGPARAPFLSFPERIASKGERRQEDDGETFPDGPFPTFARLSSCGALVQNPDTLAGAPAPFRRILLGAIVLLAAVVLFAAIVFRNTRSLVAETQAVERTRTLIGELEATLSMLKDAESGQRGYLLTGNPQYLEPYNRAVVAVRGHIDRLEALTRNNPAQQAVLRDLEDLSRRKLDELAETIRLHDSGEGAGALRLVESGVGRDLMDHIRATVDAMHRQESTLLTERTLRVAGAARQATGAALLTAACFVGLLIAFLLIVREDLLGRARAEAAARESEERLRTTLRSIGDAVLATDGSGRVTFLNPVAERLTGWPAHEAAGKAVEDVFHIVNETTRAPVESPVRRVIREGAVVGLANHTILLARDGKEVPIADSGAPIFEAGGRIAGVVLVFRDISELRRAERGTLRLAAIVASANYAIIGETTDNLITDWNPGAEALFGFAASEMVGRKMSSLAPAGESDPTPTATADLLAGRPVTEFEVRRHTRDGRWLDTVVTLSPIRDEEGRVVGISRMIRDVTERRRQSRELEEARRQAEEANAAKDRFLATLSHELRTPLTPVMASVQRLERRPDLAPGIGESLAMIRRNVELEARLIDDLLDLTRIVRGKVEIERSPLDLHAVLSTVSQNALSEFFARGVRLQSDLGAQEHFCQGDGARLQQVFWNLLKNSAKFTPSGGAVSLRTANPEPGRIRVEVSDTGQGIREDLLPKIFEAFEQGDVTAVRRAGGLGLGLAIARSLVQLHGGVITAASEGEGHGATFAVELATTKDRPVLALPPALDPDRTAARRRMALLVVEDDEDTAAALAALLAESGFDVRTADGITSAKRTFAERPADVLITDVGLPDGSGLDLLEALRPMRAELHAIVLSGYGMEEDLRRSRSLGFDEHFVKPINPSRLIAALDALAQRA
jgi:two-component system, chemotaxis family, CheB/CheR fusion protein